MATTGRMAWQQGHQTVVLPRLHQQPRRVNVVRHDAKIGGASAQRINHGLARQFLHVDIEVRRRRQESSEPVWQRFRHGCSVAKQPQGAAQAVTKAGHVDVQRLQLGQYAVRMPCQGSTCIRGGGTGLRAHQQACAGSILQRLETGAGCCQRQVHRCGCGRDTAVLHDRCKQVQIEGMDAVVDSSACGGHGTYPTESAKDRCEVL